MTTAQALTTVPVEDVTRWHAAIAPELEEAFRSCLPNHRFTLGPRLRQFEEEFAAYCESDFGVGVSNGTAALTLALRALGVGPGDEVITVPNTYVATVFAITYVGATPVFVDVLPDTVNMDPARVAAAVTPATKAIVPVHMYGRCVDIEGIRAAAPGIPILEDAAHAHGATRHGHKAGSLGEIAAFSFYPSKVLGALGDGGIVVTSSPELAAKVRQLRYMGQKDVKHEHVILGYQERLDEVQGALLSVKLRYLDEQLSGRQRVADRYAAMLADTPVELPPRELDGRHANYMYTVHAPERDALREHLESLGVTTQIVYPKLVPDQGAYKTHPWRAADDLTVAKSKVSRIVCLPMFAELTDEEVDRVGAGVRDFYGV